MKYIFILLVSFFLAVPAYAAKQVTGEVPYVPPVQSAPAGVSPSFSGSIQSSDPNYKINRPEDAKKEVAPPVHDPSLVIDGTEYKKSSAWFWWVIVLAGILGVGVWLKSKSSQV